MHCNRIIIVLILLALHTVVGGSLAHVLSANTSINGSNETINIMQCVISALQNTTNNTSYVLHAADLELALRHANY